MVQDHQRVEGELSGHEQLTAQFLPVEQAEHKGKYEKNETNSVSSNSEGLAILILLISIVDEGHTVIGGCQVGGISWLESRESIGARRFYSKPDENVLNRACVVSHHHKLIQIIHEYMINGEQAGRQIGLHIDLI